MKKTFTFLMATLFTLAMHASTNVSGGIFSNTTWTLANSPYIVTGSIVVFPGVTLTIQPGVEVRVKESPNNPIYIETRGTINMIGTLAAKITFRADSAITTIAAWSGIIVKGALGGILNFDYVSISNTAGVFGANINSNTVTTINHSEFNYNAWGIYSGFGSTNTFILNNCKFKGNGSGVYGYGTFGFKNCTFEGNSDAVNCAPNSFSMNNCVFKNNTYAMSVVYPGNINIKKCTFENNTNAAFLLAGTVDSCKFMYNQNAVMLTNATIKNSIIDSNQFAISVSDNSVVNNCRISNNQSGVIISSLLQPNQVAPAIILNKICNNTISNIDNGSNLNLFIPSNCFCETDSTLIESKLIDGYDDISKGLLSYSIFDSACINAVQYVNKLAGALSINSLSKNEIRIYPNPTNGILNIVSKKNFSSIEVIGISGKLQRKIDSNDTNTMLDVSDLDNGIYYIKAKNSNGELSVTKFVKY